MVIRRIIRENGRNYVKTYLFAAFCLILVAATTAFMAWIMESVINEAFAKKNADVIWLICASILASFIIRGAATYGQAVALAKVGNNMVARYQQRLVDHLMTLGVSYFGDTRSAQIAAQVSQNVAGIRDVMNLTVTSLSRDLLTLVALVIVMVTKDPILSLIVFVGAPPVLLALRYISKRLRSVTRDSIILNSRVLSAMQEMVQGITIVKAFTMEEQVSARSAALIKAAEERANRIARLTERTSPLTEMVAGLAISGVIAYAAFRSIYNDVLPGAFFSFITALLLAYDPARRLARLQISLERAVVNARMIYEILDEEPTQGDRPGARDTVFERARIEFRNVSFGYGQGVPVLHDVSFTAEAGKTTAIVGPSGAGKSTLISLVPRFYDPSSGQVLIDGVDIATVTKKALRQQIAYVSQQPWLFEGTIRDNLRFARPDATDAEIEDAARLANAHEFILAQPMGYDTPLGENGVNLSGGQRQRISIARALVRDAPILLLDEATSALDNESEAAVQKALEGAMRNRTVLVIAHRLSTIARADRIVVMQGGQVVETGSHADLSASKGGLYARLQAFSDMSGGAEPMMGMDAGAEGQGGKA
ncbi:MAG: ABC transporter ATP-binding protein/permease [Hoeflea sp.]|uniref:ABC transporter ATP-binding protein n=1 Tax=Hoeflea sp. TaxID=1940281 RepID=UPI001DCBC5CB|nr:ABC transporter ATP-binding protein [Hoeflea sp.]MBU4531549.1 ABC transporter ATP-binding protein/permease [Alphaproteobacteria bacterium]MBU4544406.1 ABC transporter ATP-binding protein/permease [Alphaproteobacteria bacterium]MBU4550357.1 ABC transporter ATP-binding protein/permease [Alphaproteobacteria bacterium]MBV1724825.1 ABC transporter ATP-binding protein/permease [Hoeflea sp.]MBV1760845.1 ABC transporter ATP-binding protein/permease [Hoeflea sp.]